jgi:AcrR family transcriptional regulator
MDNVVAESGLSKGTLYWYFDSKEDLFQTALLSVFEGFGEELVPVLERCETATEKLRHLGQSTSDFSATLEGYFSLFLEFWVSRPTHHEANKIWYDLLDQYQALLSAIIDEGVERGEFRPVDAEPLVWALMATYDGLAAYASFVPDLDLQDVSRVFTDVIIAGLTSDKVPESSSIGAHDSSPLPTDP